VIAIVRIVRFQQESIRIPGQMILLINQYLKLDKVTRRSLFFFIHVTEHLELFNASAY